MPKTANRSAVAKPAEVALAAFDAIESTIAVLSETGEIMYVNRAWRAFARNNRGPNGALPRHVRVGVNYLHVVKRSERDVAAAVATAKGIRSVLGGRAKRFSHVYPCHSPRKKRWFQLAVTPLKVVAKRWALLVHTDITAVYNEHLLTTAMRSNLQSDTDRGPIRPTQMGHPRENEKRQRHNSGRSRARPISTQKVQGVEVRSLRDRLLLLSTREHEVLRAMLQGKRNVDLAKELHLNPKTVSTYKKRMVEKLRFGKVEQLVDLVQPIGIYDSES